MAMPLHAVVTGVAGFVGSHMVRGLANAGVRVTGTFRRTPPPEDVARASFALIAQDLACLTALPPCDVLVHTAATSRVTQQPDSAPRGDFEQDNVLATERLLDAAAAAGCRRVVLLSSVSVYGNITASEVDEHTPLVDPDPYGASKRRAEILLEQRSSVMAGLAVRLPAVVGRGADRHWLAGVAQRLMQRQPVHVYHPAAPFNNAIHVTTLVDFVVRALAPERERERQPDQPDQPEWHGVDRVVVGAAGSITVQGAVERLARGLGLDPIIVPATPVKSPFILSSRGAIDRWGYRPEDIGSLLDRYAHDLRNQSQVSDAGRAGSAGSPTFLA
jgi:nucleoside-diphosphate-sugar epimerase